MIDNKTISNAGELLEWEKSNFYFEQLRRTQCANGFTMLVQMMSRREPGAPRKTSDREKYRLERP